jgi:DNA mismatch repair protein MSH4
LLSHSPPHRNPFPIPTNSPPCQAPKLAAALEGVTNPLLRVIRSNLASHALTALRTRVDEVITEDTTWSRSALAQRQQECFAVRPGIDGNLDAVRSVYTRTSIDIEELTEEYRTAWGIGSLRLHFTTTRGFHLVVPSTVDISEIPADDHPIQAVKNKKSIAFTTERLAALSE